MRGPTGPPGEAPADTHPVAALPARPASTTIFVTRRILLTLLSAGRPRQYPQE